MFIAAKEHMLRTHLEARGIHDPAVLRAMRVVPREEFVPPDMVRCAYADAPLPIGFGQTISQPFIVATMTQMLQLHRGNKVLEIGTGCGYQSAILAQIVREVHSVERVPELVEMTRKNCATYHNLHLHLGDGWDGWPDEAPYDRILVTAAPHEIPKPLIEQLKPEGSLVIPVGPAYGEQKLLLIRKKTSGEVTQKTAMSVRFVPLLSSRKHP